MAERRNPPETALAPIVVEQPVIDIEEVQTSVDKGKFPRELMRMRYAASDLQMVRFAEEHGFSYQTALKYAELDNWVGARTEYRREQALATRQNMLEESVRVETEIDGRAHRAAVRLTEVAIGILERYAEGDANAKKTGGPPVTTLSDAPKLKALVETLREAHQFARVTAHLTPEPLPSGLGLDANKLDPADRETLQNLLKKMAVGTKH